MTPQDFPLAWPEDKPRTKVEDRQEARFTVGFKEAYNCLVHEAEKLHDAKDFDVDGVLCGHIHTASVRNIGGVEYFNTGDWVESSTAIVEHYDGTMQLLRPEATATSAETSDSAAPDPEAPFACPTR